MTTKTPRPKIKRRTPDQVKKLLIKQGKFKEETRGRKSHRPSERDKEFVRMLAAMNVSQDDIATKMGISDDTLRKYYKDDIEVGRIDANVQVATRLYQKALQSDNTCMTFWLSRRAGWKEPDVANDGNINVTVTGGLPD